ncbi:hypothetical protein [Spirosoma telluris]|uniref:hypothetical protein n=1 Tax=Spirosoma telluris TaxID=2183553 RepID=UPI002FC3BE8F
MEQELRTIHPPRHREFDDDFFFALCQANETTKLERDANGNIILMPPPDQKQDVIMPNSPLK